VGLLLEIAAKGIDLGFMKGTFDSSFTTAALLSPEEQIAHLTKIAGQKLVTQGPKDTGSPSTASEPFGISSRMKAEKLSTSGHVPTANSGYSARAAIQNSSKRSAMPSRHSEEGVDTE
jgi:hypothetical protein